MLRAALAFPFLILGVFFSFIGDSFVDVGLAIQGRM
jgi:hypothetical protein